MSFLVVNVTGSLVFTLIKGPLELVMGVTFGCICGVFLWYYPAKDQVIVIIFSHPSHEDTYMFALLKDCMLCTLFDQQSG